MAVEKKSPSASKQRVSRKEEKTKSLQKKKTKSQENVNPSSPAKRNNCPGIRLVGGRIYDSVNGKTCHQCRQKTRDFTAACKNERNNNNKPCLIMYCHKCLLNRYGENAEEVAASGEWSCPKCRGICNCSFCMKKRGHQPTGQLTNTAKATGFSSVSEMLLKGVNGDVVGSPKKEAVLSPRKRGKENSLDANLPNHKKPKKVEGTVDDKNSSKIISLNPDKRKIKKEGLEDIHDHKKLEKKTKRTKRDKSDGIKNTKNDEKEILEETRVHDDERKPKKARKGSLEGNCHSKKKNETTLARRTSPRKKVLYKMSNKEEKLDVGVDSEENVNDGITVTRRNILEPSENDKNKEVSSKNANNTNVLKHQNAEFHVDVPLPMGKELNNVAGIDLCSEDVGNALQFLEFCAVFGQILEVKNRQPECILRDLLHGRNTRKGKLSSSVQFHINLLSILQKEQGEECETSSPSHGDNSWFDALKKCLSESDNILKAQGLVSLEKAADYWTLNASKKLRLLNLLCDEILGTDKVRNWIDDQNTKLAEKVKQAKQDGLAAREKKKSLKQKMRDAIAKAIIAAHGGLTIAEHDSIVSRIKREAEEAHSLVLASEGAILKNTRNSDAVRIEPIFVDRGGHAYWKLNYSGKSDVLRQNVGNGDTLTLDEKWFAIDDEGNEAIKKHVCSLRGLRL